MSEKVIFSIIIPCYNQSHFLEDVLNSILDQEYENFEVLIINDGSTDNTKEIATGYSKKDPHVKLFNQKNQGLSAARNTGLKNASGKFIVFLDADDWLERDFFETYSNAITLFPEFDLYRCGYSYWSADRQKKYHTHLPTKDGLIYPNVVTQNIGACHSILIRKSLADQLGEFDTTLKSCEDWDYWIRAGKVGAKIKSIPQDLVGYRYITDSMSRNAKVMYFALSEVTQRAVRMDRRIATETDSNIDLNWNIAPLVKIHFIKCLGVLLHQGKIEEAFIWYQEEKTKWLWRFELRDFVDFNSQLTFRYFLQPEQIQQLSKEVIPNVKVFFTKLDYSEKEQEKLIRLIFEPQIKKYNHLKYGRFLGACLNKIRF
ncbi:glycosyltransferase family 2 protein [Mongoliitalea daihaiensis]|uniref:glycosyltransferase family 2 protein n=1 Tax=Mongoliitalea daihaiensis TaxID=2782006 RepID=UPI001F1FDCCB|nr:glycosyltransferase [Mongoliitalea daihaiensis]UJP64170.1 glycosyltransferase [Mongoliitalea daihaiensis]